MRFLKAGRKTHLPPLLLIHGLLGYSFSWRFNLNALAQNTEVFAVDLPGVGFSERCADLDCTLRAMARRLQRFMQELGFGRVDVIGTSHGGGLAMLFAALGEHDGPVKVNRQVLSAPINPWSPHGRLIARVLATSFGASFLRGTQPAFWMAHDWLLARMYGKRSRIRPGTLEGYAKPLEVPGTLEHLLRIMRSWRADLADIEHALPSIARIPTLLVWGGRDRAVVPASAIELRRRFDDAQFVMFEDAGHLPYEEVPGEFNRVVTRFLHGEELAYSSDEQ